ncbi:nitrilase-related carbon-nitrogen hydrolase [Salinispira pacifica]|nr:nitrilase-related carbon-nitrogen hydrolase [Salinispira pacifica]
MYMNCPEEPAKGIRPPSGAGSFILAALVLFILAGPALPMFADETASGGEGSTAFNIAGIQLEISPELYASEAHFISEMDQQISGLLEKEAADLIVFPEYTSAFFPAFMLPNRILTSEQATLDQIAAHIRNRFPAESIRDFLVSQSSRDTMDRIWGGLARKHSVAILAGSYFAAHPGSRGTELRNRSILYNHHGNAVYSQDKVYLTEFERSILGLTPGRLWEARPIEYRGHTLAVTICRDSFFPAWEERLGKVDFWIDIKANGTEYDAEQAEVFAEALPRRILDGPAEEGMTVCLTGNFLELFWEGYSSVIRESDSGNIIYLSRSDTPRDQDIIRYTLEQGP